MRMCRAACPLLAPTAPRGGLTEVAGVGVENAGVPARDGGAEGAALSRSRLLGKPSLPGWVLPDGLRALVLES